MEVNWALSGQHYASMFSTGTFIAHTHTHTHTHTEKEKMTSMAKDPDVELHEI